MDTKKIALALSSVAALRAKLDAQSDLLNAEIAAFEKSFGQLASGVRVSVLLWHLEEENAAVYLVFNRYGDEHRLLLVTTSDGDDDDVQLLSSAARQTRLQAVDSFPQLLSGLADTLSAQIKTVDAKTKIVRSCIELVSNTAPPPSGEDAPF